MCLIELEFRRKNVQFIHVHRVYLDVIDTHDTRGWPLSKHFHNIFYAIYHAVNPCTKKKNSFYELLFSQ